MKSIRTKFLVLILSCVLLSSIAIGSVGIISASITVDENSKEIMGLLGSENAHDFDRLLSGIEQSLNISYLYSLNHLSDPDIYAESPELMDEYIQNVTDILENTVQSTHGAISAYLRFNPDLNLPSDGTFLFKDKATNTFKSHEMTVIGDYDKDDISHVGWYYLPINAGKPIWLDPYVNKNLNNTYMISYVIPIYKFNRTIGIIGMDIDMEMIVKEVKSISAYDTGFAFLCGSSGEVLYHKDFPSGIESDRLKGKLGVDAYDIIQCDQNTVLSGKDREGTPMKMTSRRLINDMVLVICVPSNEIDESRNTLIQRIFVTLSLVIAITIILTIECTNMTVKPIRHLTSAARKIASGDLDVDIECRSKDEIGVLANSFKETVKSLNGYIECINKQAFTDAATGVGNKAAYADMVRKTEIVMKHNDAGFAVGVMDINYLKYYNDKLGHEYGDMLISDAANLIKKVFGQYNIFRIGGDEFAVIIQNPESGLCDKLKQAFKDELENFNNNSTAYELGLHIAIGMTEYEPHQDRVYMTVFNRADREMYIDKQEIKKRNGTAHIANNR